MNNTTAKGIDSTAHGSDVHVSESTDGIHLGRSAARGFVLMTLQSILMKLATMGGQVVLAWLLLPSHFGLIGVCYSVTAIIGLVQDLGLRNVLVQRQKSFSLWAKPVFWMSLGAGLATGLLMAVCAPIAARIYNMPEITGLIFVVAIASPITALGLVPMAYLQKQLRFKAIMVIGVVQNAGQILLSILFAWMGAGAYSFVWPLPITALLVAAILWHQAPVAIGWRLHLRRWRHIFSDSLVLTLGQGCFSVIDKGGYIVLGLLYSSKIVGIYFFAYNMSLQFISLLAGQLVRVLFPILARMRGNSARQYRAFVRVQSLIATVTVPAGLLQAAISDPVIHLFFDERWYSSIPMTQLLCIGLAFASVGFSNTSLLFAQGRFAMFLVIGLIGIFIFFPFTIIGSFLGEGLGAAIGVTAYQILIAFIGIYLTIRPMGGTLSDIVRLYRLPVPLSVISIMPVWLLTMELPATNVGYLAQIVSIVVAFSISYWGLLGRFDLKSRDELLIPVMEFLGPRVSALVNRIR